MAVRATFLAFVPGSVLALWAMSPDGALAVTYTVDTTSDVLLTTCGAPVGDCSLRGAIGNANASGVADAVLSDNTVFPAATPTVIDLTGTVPPMTEAGDAVDASGRGVILDSDAARPVSRPASAVEGERQ
jgi:hypothetical protein